MQGRYYSNILYTALYRGYKQVVKILLNKGANINAQGRDYSNALYIALYRGYKQVVKILLNKGTNINI
jgi:ankyrin repeat protein